MVCKKEPLKRKWDKGSCVGVRIVEVLYHNADVTDNKFIFLDVTG